MIYFEQPPVAPYWPDVPPADRPRMEALYEGELRRVERANRIARRFAMAWGLIWIAMGGAMVFGAVVMTDAFKVVFLQ